MSKKIALIDGYGFVFRAYHSLPPLTRNDGTPVGAVFGFTNMLIKLLASLDVSHVAVVFDSGSKTFRNDIFPAYKANRLEVGSDEEEEPETLTPQIPILLDLIDAFGIPMVGVDDYEADDVMATFATHEKGPIRVVTGDRDLFQLVDDKRDIKVVYLARGISNHDLVDVDWVAQKYGIPGDRYALFAMFRGDPSDGLPGVKGIGEKGAALIANNFATVDAAIEGARNAHQSLSPSLAKKIIEGIDYLKIAPTLVNCASDVSLPAMTLNVPKKPDDLSTIYAMKEEYGLGASVDRLIAALNW